MNENQHVMSIRLSFGLSNGSERSVRLYVEDRTSGIAVLDAPLDAEQFLDLMGGGSAEVLGWFTPRPDRVGHIHQHGHTFLDGYAVTKAAAEVAAESWRVENGWDTVETRRNNGGQWVITGRRWVAPDQEK
jgi:hypothetical protein